MNAYDFINQSIGSKVYLTDDGDLAMDRNLRWFIFNKIELTLVKLTKGGRAIVEYKGTEYSVPPRNVREFRQKNKDHMKQQFAVGRIPYEPDDSVILKNQQGVHKINDIRMIQYIKARKIEFEVQIDGNWISVDLIEKRIKE